MQSQPAVSGCGRGGCPLGRSSLVGPFGSFRHLRRILLNVVDNGGVPASLMKNSWRISGILAGGLALSVLWAASRVDPSIGFPPLAFAERIVRLTPGGVATFFIDRLGHNALRLLSAGAIATFLALGAFLVETTASRGRAAPMSPGSRSPPPQWPLSSRIRFRADPLRSSSPHWPLASYGVSLAWLLEEVSDPSKEEPRLSRRRALTWIAGSTAGLILGGTFLGRLAHRLMGPNTDVTIRAPDEPAPSPTREALPSIPDCLQRSQAPPITTWSTSISSIPSWKPAAGVSPSTASSTAN